MVYNNLNLENVYTGSVDEKYLYAKIAEEDKAPVKQFFGNGQTHSTPSAMSTSIAESAEVPVAVNEESNYNPNNCTSNNLSLLKEINEALLSHASQSINSVTMKDALGAFKQTLTNIKTTGQFTTALHNFGKDVLPKRNSGRKIKCQPTALARRHKHSAKSAAPLGKGRPPSSLMRRCRSRKRRSRNLGLNIEKNRWNATSHGCGH